MNITFKVECTECGEDLDIDNWSLGDYFTIEVKPCTNCLDEAREEGAEEAKKEAESDE